ncbi:MAG: PAS domain-containing protein [Proteobacteria bacterium]|nr:PAS domain-containing protein [Pseudomonadota bacterium]
MTIAEAARGFFDAEGKLQRLVGATTDITSRKQTEKSLRQSEARFRTLFESSGNAIVLLGDQGIIDCNEAALRMAGAASIEGLVGKQPPLLSPPTQPCGESSKILAKKHMAMVFRNGKHQFEWQCRRLDGTGFLAELSLTLMELQDTPIIHASIRDITGRKMMEQSLRESETRYRTLFESSADALILLDNEHGFFEFNDATLRILGFTSREDLLGKHPGHISLATQPDGSDSSILAKEMDAKALRDGYLKFEWQLRRPDGSTFSCRDFTDAHPIAWPAGVTGQHSRHQ